MGNSGNSWKTLEIHGELREPMHFFGEPETQAALTAYE